ncbi:MULTISPECIES: DUF5987 family protein [Streptomyces]|uniref:Uncharacterized protein n=1 Tax=Streptomyces olivochromogenes TaxID=1963 RepID=A0A250VR41_STROL|nr:DUF5987 family protein [Streptomyces olivochromogenes]GAX56549.1 hypothetical protein SO3561_08117 [Streptomyces olivochromogenes]
MTEPDRRSILKALVATLAVLSAGALDTPTAEAADVSESWTTQTLEAFADTLIPGQRRFTGDVVVAGAVTGPGAVQAGVVGLLNSPELPAAPLLPAIAALLDARAVAYAALRLIWLSPTRPPFVDLTFSHRTALVGGLFDPDDLDRPIWQMLSLLVGLAFDTAGQQDTVEALGQGHPGLKWLRFPDPDADGLWRFPDFSYGRPLAALHPGTTASGSPA